MAESRLAKREEMPTELTQYDPAQYNILAPIVRVGPDVPYLRQSLAVIKLDADPNHGDCYAAPGTKWARNQAGELLPINVAPAKPGLLKIAAAMGISFRTEAIKPRSHRLLTDLAAGAGQAAIQALFNQVRHDVAYRAQIAVRDGVGYRYLEATYEWELEGQERKIRRDAKKQSTVERYKKAGLTEDQYVADRLDQVISDRHGLAESKAILRAIRATGIRHQYLREEFGKPFVVVRVDLAPDMTDPAVRQALAEKAIASGAEIFGNVPALEGGTRASDIPDFDTAEREGRIEHVAPINGDVIDGDAVEPPDQPAAATATEEPAPAEEPPPPAPPDLSHKAQRLLAESRQLFTRTNPSGSESTATKAWRAWLAARGAGSREQLAAMSDPMLDGIRRDVIQHMPGELWVAEEQEGGAS